MRRASLRLASLAAAAALILLAVAPAGIPNHVARAADRGLVVVAQTRYVALATERRVHVSIDAVATSYAPNPPDGLAYYRDVTFAVQPGATNVAATAAGQPLAVQLNPKDPDFLGVTVTFPDGIFFQQSFAYGVSYDLPDPGGAPDRNLRISPSIVAFPVWAFGSSGEAGGSVTVELPAGFRPTVQGETLVSSTGPGGEIVLATSSLPDPFNFFAYLSADRPGAFHDSPLSIAVGDRVAALNVRAWEDDPDWGVSMADLMTDGLPALQRLIGIPYPAPGTLVVEEAATSRLGEYAGVYNSQTGTIRVRYDADAYVGLHEAAHLWFNGDLFPDRWIGEAYAEFYGVEAAKSVGRSGHAFDLTGDLLTHRIALNDWGAIGAVDINIEEYAYAASYHLALLVFAKTDVAGLQTVWRAAFGHEMAYQAAHPAGSPEVGVDDNLSGWQELLDLLDERTGASFDDLWSAWVVTSQQQLLMDDRLTARTHYAAAVEAAGAWSLPKDLRETMGAWHFDQAQADLALADEVLAAREQIATASGRLGLHPPAALQRAFEGGESLPAAVAEAGHEVDVLAAISRAADRLAEPESFLESIGLIGEHPMANLDAARAAFEGDRLDAGARDAEQALATRLGAENVGQTRVLVGAGGVIVVGGGVAVAISLRRRRETRAGIEVGLTEAMGSEPAAEPPAEPPTRPVDPTA